MEPRLEINQAALCMHLSLAPIPMLTQRRNTRLAEPA